MIALTSLDACCLITGDQTVTLIYRPGGCARRRQWARWYVDGIPSILANRDPRTETGSSSMSTQIKDGRRIPADQTLAPFTQLWTRPPTRPALSRTRTPSRCRNRWPSSYAKGRTPHCGRCRCGPTWPASLDPPRRASPQARRRLSPSPTIRSRNCLMLSVRLSNELVATQRQLVKRLFDMTATVGGNPALR